MKNIFQMKNVATIAASFAVKRVAVIAIALCISLTVAAQYQGNRQYSQNNNRYTQDYYTPQNNIHFGIKTGLNLSNLADSDNDMLKAKAGIHGGVFTEFKFDRFAVQPELLFSMQGAKETDSDYGYKGTVKMNFNYLNIPVVAKFYVTEDFCLEAGPQIGILLSAKAKASVSEGGVSVSASEDMKDEMTKVDFSFVSGVSYQLPGLPVGLFGRFSLGLNDIIADGDDGDPITNRVFQVGTFIKF